VLTVEDPYRFQKSRTVGAYLGLVPARDQSGDRDPQGVSPKRVIDAKEAFGLKRPLHPRSVRLRLGPKTLWREDSLPWGKNAKKRAVVAIARKLAVLLHLLWVSAELYDPLYNSHRRQEHEERGVV
jgi:transposase